MFSVKGVSSCVQCEGSVEQCLVRREVHLSKQEYRLLTASSQRQVRLQPSFQEAPCW